MPMGEAAQAARHIVRELRGIDLPRDPAAFHKNSALVSANLCRLAYIAFKEERFDPERDLVPSEEPVAEVGGAGLDVAQILAGGEFGEASFVIDTFFVKIIGVRLRNAIFVAFRGTKGARDWLINLRATALPFGLFSTEADETSRFPVHAGYLNLTNQIRRGVTEEIVRLARPGFERDPMVITPIVACGHSQGGAIAALFSARFNERRYDERGRERSGAWRHRRDWAERYLFVSSVFTFGAPMFAKNVAQSSLNVVHHRVVLKGDPVPSLPLKAMGFEHDSEALLLSEKPGLHVASAEESLTRLKSAFFNRQPTKALKERHSIEAYLRKLALL